MLSILIPVHNEASIIEPAVHRLIREFSALGGPFELLICENGSTDGTRAIVDALARQCPQVRVEHLPDANYGHALKHGIATCAGDLLVIFNIDFWSTDFATQAMTLLAQYDLVIGSKVMRGSRDERPALRRLITRAFNGFLRAIFGFSGTDTHGIKAFRRDRVAPIAAACVTDRSIFDTELVLRVQHAGLTITELPVNVRELRQPSYVSVAARTPEALWNLLKLFLALRRRSER